MIEQQSMLKFDEWLESEEFYNLCQDYRHAHFADQLQVVEKYEALKTAISSKFSELAIP